MNYQNILCYGDSQSNGARTYTSYPHYLAIELEKRDKKYWNTVERAISGYTARDLLKLIHTELVKDKDYSQACVMIGTNDCRADNLTDPDVFFDVMRHIIIALKVRGLKHIFVATIPPIYLIGGEYPYTSKSVEQRAKLNTKIIRATKEFDACIVDTGTLKQEHYADSVHFNDEGNKVLASLFADAIVRA